MKIILEEYGVLIVTCLGVIAAVALINFALAQYQQLATQILQTLVPG